jgi:hypothetical protein
VTRDEEFAHDGRKYACIIEYQGNERRVFLDYDYKENFFHFYIIRGLETQFPNDQDKVNIRTFWALFRTFEPDLDISYIEPNGLAVFEAANHNAELLRKHCSEILRGEQWV